MAFVQLLYLYTNHLCCHFIFSGSGSSLDVGRAAGAGESVAREPYPTR